MKKIIALSILAVSLFSWVPTAEAQYEGTDKRYAEERLEERRQWRLIKISVGAVVLVACGGVWVYQKLRGAK